MKVNELRQKYLDFFRSKDHLIMPSSSLIPQNDPTLLLIGAGMAPLKPFFTGQAKPPHPRISTCQKCMRTPDIERVGKTARHCTFFEMLGNFSFGDYFKAEAIAWAWEFITEHLRLPKEKLWVTVYLEDDEAFNIWRDKVGVPAERIVRLGKADNFWEIGSGPCGPCSEIYLDRGPSFGCGKPDCKPGCDCDRYLEFWNLVFTQFNRDEAGNYTPLEKKSIDTGMGLERIAAIMQDVPNVFEIDNFRPIVDRVAELVGKPYGTDRKTDVAIRVISEHARGVTMMVGDGVMPSNEGRGYVLRRLLRRAARYGKLMGFDQPFLHEVAAVVIAMMEEPYPELREKEAYITRVLRLEEERFGETLQQGTEILEKMLAAGKARGESQLSGEAVFRLYDTYGFPRELTEEIAAEQGMTVDIPGFEAAMLAQRERARSARQSADSIYQLREAYTRLNPDSGAVFVGYGTLEAVTGIAAMIKGDELVTEAAAGDTVEVILTETPFYAESGGQVSDLGTLEQSGGKAAVQAAKKLIDGRIVHIAQVTEGRLTTEEPVTATVDRERRQDTARNHTATHLLHKALQMAAGEHIQQAGSLVSPDLLRFDVTHYAPFTAAELLQAEQTVNMVILGNRKVEVRETSLAEAKEQGVTALFDEKYGETVRVVSVNGFSRELCGGTHVRASGEIGLFKIVGESSVGAGLRRIEAVTGRAALEYVRHKEETLKEMTALLKAQEGEAVQRLSEVLNQLREKDKEIAGWQNQARKAEVERLLAEPQTVAGVRLVTGAVTARDPEELRQAADLVRDRLESGVIVLGAVAGDKVNLVAVVTKDLTQAGLHAGSLIREVAKLTGGSGGGRPEMALAGGRDPQQLAAALRAVPGLVQAQKAGK